MPGILDGHVGATPLSGKVAAPGDFGPRSIPVLAREHQLQFLEEDRFSLSPCQVVDS
jgi:hypothetical protein